MREILPLAIGEAEVGSGGESRGKLEQKEVKSQRCRTLSSPNIRGHEGRSTWQVTISQGKAKFKLSLPHMVQVEPQAYSKKGAISQKVSIAKKERATLPQPL